MEKFPIDNVKKGMTVAVDIRDSSGRILLPEGTVLTEELIQTLKRRNIVDVIINTGDVQSRTYNQQDIKRAELMVRDQVMSRFAEEPSNRIMMALFDAVLKQEAVKYLQNEDKNR